MSQYPRSIRAVLSPCCIRLRIIWVFPRTLLHFWHITVYYSIGAKTSGSRSSAVQCQVPKLRFATANLRREKRTWAFWAFAWSRSLQCLKHVARTNPPSAIRLPLEVLLDLRELVWVQDDLLQEDGQKWGRSQICFFLVLVRLITS